MTHGRVDSMSVGIVMMLCICSLLGILSMDFTKRYSGVLCLECLGCSEG
jgi:hypothetical protein